MLGLSPIYCSNAAKDIRHLCIYPKNDGETMYLIRFSTDRVEKFNPGSNSWQDFTGAAFGGTRFAFFDTVTAENKLLMTNYESLPREYNDAGITKELVASEGTVPKCRFIEYLDGGYLLAGFLNESGVVTPNKVGWTDTGNIYRWSGGNAGQSVLYHDPLPIRGIKSLDQYVAVYKKDSIYLGRKVDTTDVFIFDLKEKGTGLINHRAIAEKAGLHYFISLNDFRTFNGVRSDSIADDTVRREVFSRVNMNRSDRFFAVLADAYDEIWFFMCSTGVEWPDMIWKYNYRLGFWYYDTCPSISAAIPYFAQKFLSYGDTQQAFGSANFLFNGTDVNSTSDLRVMVFGDSSGYTYQLDENISNENGAPIEAHWDSPDFVADEFEKNKRCLQLDFEAKGDAVTILYSTDFGTTWQSISTKTLTSEWAMYRIYFDVVARQIRFRFKNYNAGQTFYLRQYSPYFLIREYTKR